MTKVRPPNVERGMDDELAARLLSGRNSPSVLQKEALFARIHAQVAPRPAFTRWKQASLGFAAALSAAAALLFWPSTPEFATRGGGPSNEPAFRVQCLGGGESSCRRGSALAFEFAPQAEAQYFAAFARRADGAVVWYFPTANGLSLPVAENGSFVLDHAVELGAEQPPGHYEVFGVFSPAPLSRAQIKSALGEDLRGTQGVHVVRRSFEVLP